MRPIRLRPSEAQRSPERLVGAILTRDLRVAGEAWSKGRVLSGADLERLAAGPVEGRGPWAAGGVAIAALTVLLPGPDEAHEDVAAARLAGILAGPGVTVGAARESRVDLVAAHDGVLHIQGRAVERLARLDRVSVFTALDRRVVAAGTVVASAKVGPHLVREALLERAEAIAVRAAAPIVSVRPFRPGRVGAIVHEALAAPARRRFEANLRLRVGALGQRLTRIAYVGGDPADIRSELGAMVGGPDGAGLLLTAGAASTDPADPIFRALRRSGARIVSHGVPAHPGSMLWLAVLGGTTIIGLPSCGAYSRATAVDLLLPWLLAGDPPSRATVARLAHGGLLSSDQRYRFHAYARDLEAPEG